MMRALAPAALRIYTCAPPCAALFVPDPLSPSRSPAAARLRRPRRARARRAHLHHPRDGHRRLPLCADPRSRHVRICVCVWRARAAEAAAAGDGRGLAVHAAALGNPRARLGSRRACAWLRHLSWPKCRLPSPSRVAPGQVASLCGKSRGGGRGGPCERFPLCASARPAETAAASPRAVVPRLCAVPPTRAEPLRYVRRCGARSPRVIRRC